MSRPVDARQSNNRIAEQAERFHFVSRVPMLCECGDPTCQRIFLIGLDEYQEERQGGFLTAPGHMVDGYRAVPRDDQYWRHVPAQL